MDTKSNFEFIDSEGYFSIKLTGAMDLEGAKDFEKKIEAYYKEPYRHCIVNCELASDFHTNWIRAFVQLSMKLADFNKQIRLVNASDSLQKLIKAQGVEAKLKVVTSLRGALSDFGLVTAKALDVNFINPFLTATLNVLKIQCSTEAKPEKPYTKAPADKFTGDISGVIGLVSEAFSGSVVISFPEVTFLKIISRMLGENYTKMSKEIEDGAGELTNIIFGQAKIALNEKGYGIKTAIPSVISGKDHSVQQMSKSPRMVIPFKTDVGDFFVEICISE